METDKVKLNKDESKASKTRPVQAFMISLVMPVLGIWLALALYPVIYSKNIVGSAHDFADCTVLAYNSSLDAMVATNETIEIAQVDHEIKLVQAKTYEGAMYGLGFVHAKDRLF